MLTENEMFKFARDVCIKNQLKIPLSVTYKDLSDEGTVRNGKCFGKCFPFVIPNRELEIVNGKYIRNSIEPKIEIDFKNAMKTTETRTKRTILHEISHIKHLGHDTEFQDFFQELCQQNCIEHVPKLQSKLNEKLNDKISDVEELKVKILKVKMGILINKLNMEVNEKVKEISPREILAKMEDST